MNARKDIALEEIRDAAEAISEERSEVIMTIAEQLFKKGMEEGIEKGIEKGSLESRRKRAKNLLKRRLAEAQVAEATELSMEEVMGLRKEVRN